MDTRNWCGFCGAYERQVCQRRAEPTRDRHAEVLHERRYVYCRDKDMASSSRSVSSELWLEGNERVDLWIGRAVYAHERAVIWRARHSAAIRPQHRSCACSGVHSGAATGGESQADSLSAG